MKLYNIKNKFKQSLSNDRYLVLVALIFFICYRFWLINVEWSGRNIAPEPDDSYSYISLINLATKGQSFENLPGLPLSSFSRSLYTPYSIVLATIAKIMNSSAETIYMYNFYFGTIVLALVLIYLFKNYTKNNKLIAFSLFILAFYNGSGLYHGFYWVVPSFFSLLMFFILLAQINSKWKCWYFIVVLGSLVFVLVHPISLYASIIFPIYTLLFSLMKKKLDLKKVFRGSLLLASSIIWFALTRVFFLYKGVAQDTEASILGIIRAWSNYLTFLKSYANSIQSITSQTGKSSLQAITTETNPLSPLQTGNWSVIQTEYVSKLFPNPIFILIFVFLIYILYRKKEYWVVSLYVSAVIFVIISTFAWFGYRSLLFLWPITFIVLAYGIYHTLSSIHLDKLKSKAIYAGIIIMILIFCTLTTTLNYTWAKNLNIRNNLILDRSCIDFLLANTGRNDPIYYENRTTKVIFRALGMEERKVKISPKELDPDTFIITANYNHNYYQPKNKIQNIVLSYTSRKNVMLPAEYSKTEIKSSNILVKNCGDFKIYKQS